MFNEVNDHGCHTMTTIVNGQRVVNAAIISERVQRKPDNENGKSSGKIGSLFAKSHNTSRLIEAIHYLQSPQLKLLMNNHFRDGGSMNLFISKLVKSSELGTESV
jgi:hypothetical protein